MVLSKRIISAIISGRLIVRYAAVWKGSLFLLTCLMVVSVDLYGVNFTRGADTARLFGVHEIILTGDGSVPNPLDTPCKVTFTSPSGVPVTVNAFYDCRNTWRARCYVNETGRWSWRSSSSHDPGLDDKSGSFMAVDSDLRGKIIRHPAIGKALATDDGKWFLSIGDTPYYLFQDEKTKWQEYIREDQELGITFVRAAMIGALDNWDPLFKEGDHDRLNVHDFQINDARLIWMLDNYPAMYVEFILLPGCNTGWGQDETFWYSLTQTQRRRILRYIVARYAAFPEIIWQIVNDYKFSTSHLHNVALAREVGNYLMKNDPWQHLITAGGVRGDDFYFTGEEWATFIHLETLDALAADQTNDYTGDAAHVFCGEDRYETYRQPDHPKIFFRRLIWSWTLSGGSACYGGDWDDIIPYSESSLKGLDNIVYVKRFFRDHDIDLSKYVPDDNCVTSNARGLSRPKVMRTPQSTSYVIYHPNASVNGQEADISTGTPYLSIDDLPSGNYTLLWMRADNGEIQKNTFDHSGGYKLLVSPWAGTDAVLYLRKEAVTETELIRSGTGATETERVRISPNPFSSKTSISLVLQQNMYVSLDVLDMQGKLVERIASGQYGGGEHTFFWFPQNRTVGVYLLKVKTGNKVCVYRMDLLGQYL